MPSVEFDHEVAFADSGAPAAAVVCRIPEGGPHAGLMHLSEGGMIVMKSLYDTSPGGRSSTCATRPSRVEYVRGSHARAGCVNCSTCPTTTDRGSAT